MAIGMRVIGEDTTTRAPMIRNEDQYKKNRARIAN